MQAQGFRVLPDTLPMKLRYTDSQELRDWCGAAETLLAPAYERALAEARRASVEFLLYGTSMFNTTSARALIRAEMGRELGGS